MSDEPKPLAELLAWSHQASPGRRVGPTKAFIEFPREALERSILDRFEDVVGRYPDRVAVKTRSHALTYDALNRAANRVAHAILARRGAGPEPIALLLEKDAPLVAAILAVLKAGKIFLCLNPAFPLDRLRGMLEDARAGLIVTDSRYAPLAGDLSRAALPWMNLDALDVGLPAENVGLSLSSDAVAYITYTSSSTGQPKGISQNHCNLLHDIMVRTNIMHLCPEDRLSWLGSPSFAASLKDLFSALLNGASLFPFDLQEEGITRLAPWLIGEGITLYHSVPTVFRHFAERLTGAEAFPRLRLLYVGGEQVSPLDVELYRAHFAPQCLLLVMLSCTEAGSIRHIFFDKATRFTGSIVPVGYAVPDKEVLLLDEAGGPVGVNAIGEIAVKSRYLSLGYWRQQDRTRAAFLPDPEGGDARIYRTGDLGRLLPDGCLEHLGRKDLQVKVRGVRVELAEVEAALLRVGNIKEAVVVAREGRAGDTRLVAYLVPAGLPAPTVTTLRCALAETLPDSMIPSSYVLLDALPLTANGKVDRRALPPPETGHPELATPFAPPRTPVEERLAAIWAEVLGLDCIGIHDGFLELGGNSLLAAQVTSRVIAAFRVELPLQSLFEAPTVAAMAAVIAQRQATEAEPVGQMLAELEALPEEEAQRLLARETSLGAAGSDG